MYEELLRPVLFRFDPERVHDLFVSIGEMLGRSSAARSAVGAFCSFEHPALRTRVAGIDFPNPVGLAAGFDKDVRLAGIMPSVGFGFMEVGAVTRWPYEGNPGPRLVRLPADKSLIVYYGLKNIGAEAVEKKLREGLAFGIPAGLNIAKTNRSDIKGDLSAKDYASTYRMLAKYFSYVTLNISCPNAQDGVLFQDPQMLKTLLAAIEQEPKPCPVFLKVSSDLSEDEMDSILDVVGAFKFVDGFVIGNLAKRREKLALSSPAERLSIIPRGGISGKPVKALSTNLIRRVYKRTGGKYAIIGLGGIFTAEDAYEKIKAGASLVQIVTGLIYGGPAAVKKINEGLAALLKRDGYSNISEAVGKEAA